MDLIGRFYFLLTTSGNLLGEFSNNFEFSNTTESADRVAGDRNSFIGSFTSTWHERGNSFIVDLNIAPLTGGANVFTLEWIGRNGINIHFWGEALIAGDRLIGNYADFPLRFQEGN